MKFKRNNFFVSYLVNAKPFLTWQPSNRFVYHNQKHYLTYLHTSTTATAINLVITTTFTDGTNNVQTVAFPLINKVVYHIATGIQQLGLNLIDPTKMIHWYEVKVVDQFDINLVSAYRFYPEYNALYSYYDFIYFNSLGGLDSVRVKGEVSLQVDNSSEEIEHIIYKDDYNTTTPQPQFSSVSILKRDVYKGDVGFQHSPLQQEALVELLMSRGIYEMVDGRWIKIINIKKSQDLRTTADKKWSFPIEWKYGYEDSVFTPKGIMLGDGTI